MRDPIFDAFLTRQRDESLALNAASDIVTLTPVGGTPADRYLIDFRCRGLARDANGDVRPADQFVVGVYFSTEYVRSIPNPFQVLTVLHPIGAFQPNIAEHAPFVCPGRLPPGMPLTELTYQLWELWTWRKFNLVDGLNPGACAYARQHLSELPLDPRPLKRSAPTFTLEAVEDRP